MSHNQGSLKNALKVSRGYDAFWIDDHDYDKFYIFCSHGPWSSVLKQPLPYDTWCYITSHVVIWHTNFFAIVGAKLLGLGFKVQEPELYICTTSGVVWTIWDLGLVA